MPIKIPNTYNAQTPLGQAVSNAMTAYFSNMPDEQDMAKAQYMRQQGDLMAAQAEQARRRGQAADQLGNTVREYMQKQRPQKREQEQPRPSTEFAGPMPSETVMVPGMSREEANAMYVPDIISATYNAGHGMKLPDLMLALAPLQGAPAEDYTSLALGAGKPYSSTPAGFRDRQMADMQKTSARQGASDARAAAVDRRAEEKQQAAIDTKTQGRRSVEATLQEINSLYDTLQSGGGAIAVGNSPVDNMVNWLAARGGPLTAGTENQSTRNSIKSKIPLISAAIKNATGMSSQQLNSNFELQQFMKALADPDSTDYEAAKDILRSLSSQFGMGGLNEGKTINPVMASEPAAQPEQPAFTPEQIRAEKERRRRLKGGQ